MAPAFHAAPPAVFCKLFPLTVTFTAFAHVTGAHVPDVAVGVAVIAAVGGAGFVGVSVAPATAVGVMVCESGLRLRLELDGKLTP